MKICILTQPLHTNYGGLLQAYALQIILKRMGHEVWTEDRRPSLYRFIRQIAGRILKGNHYTKPSDLEIISRNTREFVRNNIQLTVPISSCNKRQLLQYDFDAFVVGSDQVWRPRYSYGLENYFLDFTQGMNVKRIAYAASFGSSEWEFSPKQNARCSKLAQRFDAISVREDSAVELCDKYLGVKATHVLDPTMLLSVDDYMQLINEEVIPVQENMLFTYILDPTSEKQQYVSTVAQQLGLKINSGMPITSYRLRKDLSQMVFPSVANWLAGFRDAKFIVTDSFHGCVFSIIFNKPFVAFNNEKRGSARLLSLLRTFNQQERIINIGNFEVNTKTVLDSPNYKELLEMKREQSMSWLNSTL